nr:hypothetical protein CFP56_20354 [Quercus suber]
MLSSALPLPIKVALTLNVASPCPRCRLLMSLRMDILLWPVTITKHGQWRRSTRRLATRATDERDDSVDVDCSVEPPILMTKNEVRLDATVQISVLWSESLHQGPSQIYTMPKTYDANCHCGSVKFTVTLDEALSPEGPGYLLVYPKREDVVFRDGSEAHLKDYFFGNKTKPHRFCSECGSSVLIDFINAESERMRETLAINVSLLIFLTLSGASAQTHRRSYECLILAVKGHWEEMRVADSLSDSSLQRH